MNTTRGGGWGGERETGETGKDEGSVTWHLPVSKCTHTHAMWRGLSVSTKQYRLTWYTAYFVKTKGEERKKREKEINR